MYVNLREVKLVDFVNMIPKALNQSVGVTDELSSIAPVSDDSDRVHFDDESLLFFCFKGSTILSVTDSFGNCWDGVKYQLLNSDWSSADLLL